MFSSRTIHLRTTMTSWRWGPDPSTVLLLLGSLPVPSSHRRCWAPPTWPSSTSTATTRRTGQASNSTTRVTEWAVLRAWSLHFCTSRVLSSIVMCMTDRCVFPHIWDCVRSVVSVHSVIAVKSFTGFFFFFARCVVACLRDAYPPCQR